MFNRDSDVSGFNNRARRKNRRVKPYPQHFQPDAAAEAAAEELSGSGGGQGEREPRDEGAEEGSGAAEPAAAAEGTSAGTLATAATPKSEPTVDAVEAEANDVMTKSQEKKIDADIRAAQDAVFLRTGEINTTKPNAGTSRTKTEAKRKQTASLKFKFTK
jgi:hypothetical protein